MVNNASQLSHKSSPNWQCEPSAISKVGGKVKLCCLEDLPDLSEPGLIPPNTSFVLLHPTSSETLPSGTKRILHLSISAGKKGQYDFLHQVIPQVVQFAGTEWKQEERDIVIACRDGKDTSIGVALTLLQLYFDDAGKLEEFPSSCKSTYSFGISLTEIWLA